MNISYKLIQGADINNYISELAALRILIFKDYPYLYEGDLNYEKKYLNIYVNSKKSLLVLAYNNSELIGASTALPLIDETDYVQKPFIQNNFDINSIFYFGESILKKDYRGLGVGKQFFKFREQHADSFKAYNKLCFCAVNRDEQHPLKPDNYVPLDTFWQNLGYKKNLSIQSTFSWCDLGETNESEKQMTFWMKDLFQ